MLGVLAARRIGRRVFVFGIAAALAALLGSLALVAPAGAAKNGPIVFTSYDDVWKIQPSGSGIKRISGKDVRSLAAAPNGKTLAYTDGDLKTMSMTGKDSGSLLKRYSTVRRLSDIYWADYSRDGKRIAFVGHNDARIYTIKTSGKGLQYVFGKHRTGLGYPHYSPKANEIAFIDYRDDSSLKTVDLRTGKTKLVYSGADPRAGTPVNFDYMPDGKGFIFYAPYRNWLIDKDGSDLRQVTANSPQQWWEDPSFSPDGKSFVGEQSSELYNLGFFPGFTGTASGSNITSAFVDSAFSPAWAPAPRN